MWFNHAQVFNVEFEKNTDIENLLATDALKPCPPHARFIYGWLPGITDSLSYDTQACSLITLGKEERILPRAVIQRFLKERIQTIETNESRTVKRAEKNQLAEDVAFELLPKAFCIQKRLPAILDHLSHRLIINTSSAQQASQLTSLLRKSLPGIKIEPLACDDNLSMRFAEWILNPGHLPQGFELASDCLLFSPTDDKKRFNCKGYELPATEVTSLLEQGLAVQELSLVWQERIQFTLTNDLTLKKIKCLDYLIDEFNEIRQQEDELQQQDSALLLLVGELRGVINGLLQAVTLKTAATLQPTSEIIE